MTMAYTKISYLIGFAAMNFYATTAIATFDLEALNDNEISNDQLINMRTLSKCGNDGKGGKGGKGKRGKGKGKNRRRTKSFTDEDCNDENLDDFIDLLDEAQHMSNDCTELVERGLLDPSLCTPEDSEKYLTSTNVQQSRDFAQNLLFEDILEIPNVTQEIVGHNRRRHLRKVYSKQENADKVI
mmetsp:Transcript_45900/g.53703  ORF Transcript_45900/g.53703 Transcript_45900/m.53703 type:complete len:184 (-) Transcript_45900:80-631(-)